MRERTRRLVRGELSVIAQDLFVEQGYEETTVEQIAAAAGMSKRTFFRHFASKEDLVIGKYDLFGDRMAEALAARPADELVWESLRRVLDITAVYLEDGPDKVRNDAMDRIVHSTPTLTAGYLEKLSRMQDLLVEEVARRLGNGTVDPLDPRPTAIVGAAFACMTAAQAAFGASDQSRPFAEFLDESMNSFNIT